MISVYLYHHISFKVNEPRHIALFVFSVSVKKLFSIAYFNICFSQSIVNYLVSIFFQQIYNCEVNKHCLYHDSLTLTSSMCDAISYERPPRVIVFFYFCQIVAHFLFPVGIYMLKVNNRNTRTKCEICSELTIKLCSSVSSVHVYM